MKTIDQWFAEYQRDHQDPTNQILHKICVPAIVFSTLGLLFCIPFPLVSAPGLDRVYMNWAAVSSFFLMIFYLLLVPRFAFPLLVLVLCMLGTFASWDIASPNSILPVCVGIFVLAWIGQGVGHHMEGRRPSFLKDLHFLLIGPVWVLAFLLDLS